jgi:hypothetical protein
MYVPFSELDDASRVWIFQADQELSDSQASSIQAELIQFLDDWTAHNETLHAYGEVVHRRFVTLFVDERFAGTSGCSIDKSVHFMQYLEKKHGISLLERTQVAFLDGHPDDVQDTYRALRVVPIDQLRVLHAEGSIHDNTWVFDNLVNTKGAFSTNWLKPISQSWHQRFVRP